MNEHEAVRIARAIRAGIYISADDVKLLCGQVIEQYDARETARSWMTWAVTDCALIAAHEREAELRAEVAALRGVVDSAHLHESIAINRAAALEHERDAALAELETTRAVTAMVYHREKQHEATIRKLKEQIVEWTAKLLTHGIR